jgi:hypothetical protein
MFRTMIVLLAAVLLVATASAQDKDKKTETKTETKKFVPPVDKTPKAGPAVKAEVGLPGEVEINFLNGSTVRMILQSEKLEIATPYGQLAVPTKEIRAVEFGLHFPDGINARIQQAVKSLGADNYRERDQAGKTLLELGPYSFPAVLEASSAGDLEVSRRAKELVKQLQARHPKKDLKTATEDRVVTPTFTIVGRILTATIKAKAELFGDVELPVARMRALRSFTGAALEIDVTIDAARYANQGQWLETDFQVDGRTAVVVTAKGQVDVWPQQGGQFIVGPNGLQGRNQGMRAVMVAGQKIAGPLNGQIYGGALLGKIGEDGETFTIGERYEGTPEATGKLYLHIGPSPWNAQATGTYDVKISRKN